MIEKSQEKNINWSEIEREIKLANIFWPYGIKQRSKLYGNPKIRENPIAHFVHYTSAESALRIIGSKRVWMRNATCMADYREVQHGFDILQNYFADKTRLQVFTDAFDAHFQGAALEAINRFNQHWNDIRFNTYITSISEHDQSENVHGRLSMWRAFGGGTARVAIVIKIPWIMESGNPLNLVFSPIAYLSENDVHKEMDDVSESLKSNASFISSLNREEIIGAVFHMLLSRVACLKHEGFREEREWRILHAPNRNPSPLMERSSEIIGGIPQTVFKIPLEKKVHQIIVTLKSPASSTD